jgi:hypothetical protein
MEQKKYEPAQAKAWGSRARLQSLAIACCARIGRQSPLPALAPEQQQSAQAEMRQQVEIVPDDVPPSWAHDEPPARVSLPEVKVQQVPGAERQQLRVAPDPQRDVAASKP